jgi:hypothetical protein
MRTIAPRVWMNLFCHCTRIPQRFNKAGVLRAGSMHIVDQQQDRGSTIFRTIMLLVSLSAGVLVFIPYAVHTSPVDAVMLNVPGDQGNWWHVLIGAPFFLAFPMIWLRLRAFFSRESSTPIERRFIWTVVILCVCGTFAVEMPFLLHRAGTSEAQRLAVLLLGYGIPIVTAVLLSKRKAKISPTRACLIGLNAAYLANAGLCLPVYGQVAGALSSKPGWLVMLVIVWALLLEIVWIFVQASRTMIATKGRG